MGEFSFVEMWQKMGPLAKGVNIFLVVMSLFSLGVIIERLLTYSAGSRQSLSYVLALRDFMNKGNVQGAIAAAKLHNKSPIAKVMIKQNAGTAGRDINMFRYWFYQPK